MWSTPSASNAMTATSIPPQSVPSLIARASSLFTGSFPSVMSSPGRSLDDAMTVAPADAADSTVAVSRDPGARFVVGFEEVVDICQ